jgi:predicted HD phosphohydrolase
MNSVDTLRTLFSERGSAEYFGEVVSQATHMLQAGALARREAAPPALVRGMRRAVQRGWRRWGLGLK